MEIATIPGQGKPTGRDQAADRSIGAVSRGPADARRPDQARDAFETPASARRVVDHYPDRASANGFAVLSGSHEAGSFHRFHLR
jgi:hypothetical protein